MTEPQLDSVVRSVLKKFVDRATFGKQKYGTDLDRQDLGVLDWIQHAQEEHMDAILYLEKLKQTLISQEAVLQALSLGQKAEPSAASSSGKQSH
jgi:hypothetical protein